MHDSPTASLEKLQQRAALLQAVRSFFQKQRYWEVETPVLSQETVIDLHLEPFPVQGDFGGGQSGQTFYLQTSPEFAMKRLLAAGADRIFQITRAFRQGEQGQLHNPEFTLLEWYALHEDHFAQMDFVEQLCRTVFAAAVSISGQEPTCRLPESPFRRLSYAEAFQQVLGLDVLAAPSEQLFQVCRDLHLPVSGDEQLLTQDEYRDDLLNLLLAEQIEPWLISQGALFLHAYPVSQAALARACPEDARVAERFELYLDGIELCNGYHELTDAAELTRRNRRQNALRRARGLPALPEESRLLSTMQRGLPPCSGVAVGLDRLVMLALNCQQLSDVIPFPSAIA